MSEHTEVETAPPEAIHHGWRVPLTVHPRTLAIWAAIVMAIAGTIGLAFWPVPHITAPGLLAFLGRLHPILVHFPVVLVPLLAVFAGYARWKQHRGLRFFLDIGWCLTVPATLAAVLAGYLLYASGEYGGDLVQKHLKGGVIVAVCLLAAAAVHVRYANKRMPRPWLNAHMALLLASNGALVYTGHQGGSLTHGESFLSEAWPLQETSALMDIPREEWQVFGDIIQPMLELRCVSCHNTNKTKGGLQLTGYSQILAGGDSERPTLVAGDAPASELYHRITLPPDDDDAMPPDGKAPLKPIEMALIAWWIEEGADPEMRYGAGPENPELVLQLDRYLPELLQVHTQRRRDREAFVELYEEFEEAIEPMGLVAGVDPESDSTLFAVSMQVPPTAAVDDNTIAALIPYAALIGTLSLVSSDITDDALYHIGRMPNVRALYLANTAIDGTGLAYLAELEQLAEINLSNTSLTGAGSLHLVHYSGLQRVYLYNTNVGGEVVDALSEYRPEVQFLLEEGPLVETAK